jgi:PAS domain S-box-containing protein
MTRVSPQKGIEPLLAAQLADDWLAEARRLLQELKNARAKSSNHHTPISQQQLARIESSITAALANCQQFRRYDSLFRLAPVGYVILDLHGKIQETNQTAAQMLGLSPSGLTGRSLTALMSREDAENFSEHLRRCRSSGRKKVIELSLRAKGGALVKAELVIEAFAKCEDRRGHYRIIIVDVSRRKQPGAGLRQASKMEVLLRRAHSELELRVQERTVELVRTCEQLQQEIAERKRLEAELLDLTNRGHHQSLDMHGEVGQNLAGIALMIKSLGVRLEKTSPSEAGHAERIHSLVDETMARSQDPAQGLLGLEIAEPSLPLALKKLAERAGAAFQISCRFKPHGNFPPIHSDLVTQSYNIALEAVVNAVRYAEARRVVISLKPQEQRLVLKIESDGHPFPTPQHRNLELGIKIMHYRAKLVGAHLQIDSANAHGPRVLCVFPA